MSKKKIKFKDLPKSIRVRKIIMGCIYVVAIGCLGYFGYYCLQASNTQNNYEDLALLKEKDTDSEIHLFNPAHVTVDDIEIPDILEEYQILYSKNKSLIGWVKIDDTLIDYPVMQSSNQDYYLTHNFSQEKDNNGSIFIDKDCCIWPRSQNLILYGHNMKSGKMFGTLAKYKSQSYYEKHPFISFDTLYEKGLYQVMYVFSEVVHDETEVTFKYYQFINANSAEEWDSNMAQMAEKSLYDTGVTSQYGDQLITLSTCDYSAGSERFAVVAKRIQ